DRDQRYHTANELLADLEAVSASASPTGTGPVAVYTPPPAPVSPPRPPATGHPLRSGMIVIAAVLLVALAGMFFLFRNHSTTKPGPAVAAAKNSIIVADFINKTGDPVFDSTLNQALRVQLGQ